MLNRESHVKDIAHVTTLAGYVHYMLTGAPVAMVHSNNCTNDTNTWAGLLKEASELFGAKPSTGEVFT